MKNHPKTRFLRLRGLALAALVAVCAPIAFAQTNKAAEHVKADIARHRAMAAAHDAAARCLESGKAEAICLKDLQSVCKGLAIGKYCGMKHEH